MNDRSNLAMMPDPDFRPPQGALPVWSRVFTKPGEQTFLEITDHPEAKARSAYIWVFVVGALSGLINGVLQFVVSMLELQQAAPELTQTPGATGVFGAVGLAGVLCSAPLAGVFSVISFAIGTAIVHATAKFFGGQGNFDKLAYAFGAITVPFSLLSALIAPLNAIPFVVFCTLPVLLGLVVYVMYLQVAAIKAVHGLGWGESAAALLLPSILIALLCGLLFVVLLRMAGPSINEIFQQLQQFQ